MLLTIGTWMITFQCFLFLSKWVGEHLSWSALKNTWSSLHSEPKMGTELLLSALLSSCHYLFTFFQVLLNVLIYTEAHFTGFTASLPSLFHYHLPRKSQCILLVLLYLGSPSPSLCDPNVPMYPLWTIELIHFSIAATPNLQWKPLNSANFAWDKLKFPSKSQQCIMAAGTFF